MTVIKNGQRKDLLGINVEAVPMYNLTRGPQAGQLFHDKGRGNGYVLTFGDKRVYLSGDTECIPEMKALKNIDVAFVCMNLPYTMPPSEAADVREGLPAEDRLPLPLPRLEPRRVQDRARRSREHRCSDPQLVSVDTD